MPFKVVYHFTNIRQLALVLLPPQEFARPPCYYYRIHEIIKHTLQKLPLIPWCICIIFR